MCQISHSKGTKQKYKLESPLISHCLSCIPPPPFLFPCLKWFVFKYYFILRHLYNIIDLIGISSCKNFLTKDVIEIFFKNVIAYIIRVGNKQVFYCLNSLIYFCYCFKHCHEILCFKHVRHIFYIKTMFLFSCLKAKTTLLSSPYKKKEPNVKTPSSQKF